MDAIREIKWRFYPLETDAHGLSGMLKDEDVMVHFPDAHRVENALNHFAVSHFGIAMHVEWMIAGDAGRLEWCLPTEENKPRDAVVGIVYVVENGKEPHKRTLCGVVAYWR